MSNLMINTPATRHSLLSQKAGVSTIQSPSLLARHPHPLFLTSEVLVSKNALTTEQELAHYVEQAYPRTR